jgi:hypothetical protein
MFETLKCQHKNWIIKQTIISQPLNISDVKCDNDHIGEVHKMMSGTTTTICECPWCGKLQQFVSVGTDVK